MPDTPQKPEEYIMVTVREPWQNMVAVRDRYVKEAKDTGKGLKIVYRERNKAVMLLISNKQLILGRQSDKAYKDQFSQKMHYLIYYPIAVYKEKEPNGGQQSLLPEEKPAEESYPPQNSLFNSEEEA